MRVQTEISVIADGGKVHSTVSPVGAPVDATLRSGITRLHIALRGRGDVSVRFEGCAIADIDVRGGYAIAEPGTPYLVRATVDGRLSITARLRQVPRP